ncbi:MAG: alginate export family protein [Sphingomonadales bacterium]|nr:alginate export family protein [Sphingomonadales bacterium]
MNKTKQLKVLLSSLLASSVILLPQTTYAESFQEAIEASTPILNLRYRYENVSQDGVTNDANAHTLRTVVGIKTGSWNGFSAVLEMEDVTHIDGDFNSTTNGNILFPVVADPDGTEINQAKLIYTGIENTAIIAGRQEIALDNQRFVGPVGFRQNHQSYDAVVVQNTAIENLTATYAYVWQVNRIFGNDHALGDVTGNSHVFNLGYKVGDIGKLTGYGIFLDVHEVGALSTKTFGARFAGSQAMGDGKVSYALEYAGQSDYTNNAADFNENYTMFEAGYAASGFNVKLGMEILSGDGTTSFKTPLATLHKFQGFADVFLVTPADGIKNPYVSASYTKGDLDGYVKSVKVAFWYHDFNRDTGVGDYGTEWDGLVQLNMEDNWVVSLKYADFNSSSSLASRQKLWFTVGYKY